MNIINPFLISGYHSPAYFCNREKELKQLKNAIYNGRNITLFSPRRLGKTGLIHHLFYQTSPKKAKTIYIDAFGTENLNQFVIQFANAVIRNVSDSKSKFIKTAMKLISSVRPQFTFNQITGVPEMTFITQNENEKEITLREIFSIVEQQDVNCIVAIDEFQQITQYPEKNVEQLLRTHIQQLKKTKFIFSGSQKHLLVPMFFNAKRAFYQSTDFLSLEKLEKETYFNFIKHHFENNSQDITDIALNMILEWSKTYTFYTQYLCNKIFSKSLKKITEDVIKNSIMEVFFEREMIYHNYKKLLTQNQHNLLKAIAIECFVKEPTSQDFIKKYNLGNASSVRKALISLVEKEAVYEHISETGSAYEVYDLFLARWLQWNYSGNLY